MKSAGRLFPLLLLVGALPQTPPANAGTPAGIGDGAGGEGEA